MVALNWKKIFVNQIPRVLKSIFLVLLLSFRLFNQPRKSNEYKNKNIPIYHLVHVKTGTGTLEKAKFVVILAFIVFGENWRH